MLFKGRWGFLSRNSGTPHAQQKNSAPRGQRGALRLRCGYTPRVAFARTGAEGNQVSWGLVFRFFRRGANRNLGCNETRIGTNRRFDGIGHILVLFQEFLRLVTALPDAFPVIGIP